MPGRRSSSPPTVSMAPADERLSVSGELLRPRERRLDTFERDHAKAFPRLRGPAGESGPIRLSLAGANGGAIRFVPPACPSSARLWNEATSSSNQHETLPSGSGLNGRGNFPKA